MGSISFPYLLGIKKVLKGGGSIGSATSFSAVPYVLKLDSSDINTITFGTGQQVRTQADKSIDGNDFEQLTSSSQPIFQTGVQNGLASILYDGVDDLLEGTVDFQSETAYTIFIVCGFTTGLDIGSLFSNSGSDSRQINIMRRSDAPPRFDVFLQDSSSNLLRPTPACPASAHCLLTIQYETGRIITGVNGINYTETTGTYTAESLAGGTPPRVGGVGGGVLSYNGHIDEIRIASGIISESWRTAVDSELISKWGL